MLSALRPSPCSSLCPCLPPAPIFLIAMLLCLSAWPGPAGGARLELAPEISLEIPGDWHIIVAPPAPDALETLKDGEELSLLKVSGKNNAPLLSASVLTVNEAEGEELRQTLIKYQDHALDMWSDMFYAAFTAPM
ncbi:hypothetical protein LJC15_04335, partial [Desulfovibrio sp. OttesenSCG-928-G11]|nr:hypothetical protein [Desulfovibrio sp. OttesenSCG-928-G11]